MILTDHRDRPGFGYAQLLVADYHLEYPLKTDWPRDESWMPRVELIWDPNTLGFAIEDLNRLEGKEVDFHDEIQALTWFEPLDRLYGGHWEPAMALWSIIGDVESIKKVWSAHYQEVIKGPEGGDDTTYDYWPNAMDMLLEMTHDLIRLTGEEAEYVRAWDYLIAEVETRHGPLEDYEAEEYRLGAKRENNEARD